MVAKSLNRNDKNLTHLGYDAEKGVLAVCFKGKDIYTYTNVSPEQFETLEKAGDDVGTKFQAIKKNPAHQYAKVNNATRVGEDYEFDV